MQIILDELSDSAPFSLLVCLLRMLELSEEPSLGQIISVIVGLSLTDVHGLNYSFIDGIYSSSHHYNDFIIIITTK
jgi:hypothetical protein